MCYDVFVLVRSIKLSARRKEERKGKRARMKNMEIYK